MRQKLRGRAAAAGAVLRGGEAVLALVAQPQDVQVPAPYARLWGPALLCALRATTEEGAAVLELGVFVPVRRGASMGWYPSVLVSDAAGAGGGGLVWELRRERRRISWPAGATTVMAEPGGVTLPVLVPPRVFGRADRHRVLPTGLGGFGRLATVDVVVDPLLADPSGPVMPPLTPGRYRGLVVGSELRGVERSPVPAPVMLALPLARPPLPIGRASRPEPALLCSSHRDT